MPISQYTCIIIGTGFSGLAMGIKLKEKGIHDFIILEKKEAVGGTWRENTYPGAECDIPSVLYSYSFEPNPNWEFKWSLQHQILAYIEHVVEKYELNPHIHFQQELEQAHWQEKEGQWQIKTKSGESYTTKNLVTAIGQLHHPYTPEFEGKATFKKPNWHSAQWNHSSPLAGKTVGVIGNAASAVQFIPEIAKTAKELIIFQRTANWVIPKQDRAYKNWEKTLVKRIPFLQKIYRFSLWLKAGLLFMILQDGNKRLRKIFEYYGKWYLKKNIKSPQLIKDLTPKFPLGAKRVLFSDTYYQALAKPHVKLVTGAIQSINNSGVVVNEQVQELDVLIYSTGFKTNPFLLGLDIRGEGGISIQEYWKDSAKNYLGMSMSHFPNLYVMYGPNTNLGHNSIILMSECQSEYIATCISEMKKKDWSAMVVKEAVLEKYHQDIQERLGKMVWSKIRNSWYQTSNGNIPNNYPGRSLEYMRRTKRPNFTNYIIRKGSKQPNGRG